MGKHACKSGKEVFIYLSILSCMCASWEILLSFILFGWDRQGWNLYLYGIVFYLSIYLSCMYASWDIFSLYLQLYLYLFPWVTDIGSSFSVYLFMLTGYKARGTHTILSYPQETRTHSLTYLIFVCKMCRCCCCLVYVCMYGFMYVFSEDTRTGDD